MKTLTKWAVSGISFILFIAAPLIAAETNELGGLKKEIEELRKKVEEIEQREKAEQKTKRKADEILAQFGKNFGAFGDINYSTDSREKENQGFSVGSLGFFTTASYNNKRLNFLFEMAVDSQDGESSIELERLWVGWTFNDLITVRAGRFHTALGYWNIAYHHAKLLFPTVDRPFFLDFEEESGVLPVHIIGIEFAGSADIAKGRFKYLLEVGNGPKFNGAGPLPKQLTPNAFTDDNNSKQFALRISFEPKTVPNLAIAIFGTNFKIQDPAIKINEAIFGSDLYYKKDSFEFIGEFFRFKNGTSSANAYYLQLAYITNRFTPYMRHERLDPKTSDPYMSSLIGGGERIQNIVGVKYDIDEIHSAIKAQYRHDDKHDEHVYDVLELQWAFHF